MDSIHTGVVQLKKHAVNTNDEVVAQNAMIDSISIQMDEAGANVQTQTENARKVARHQRQVSIAPISAFR